VPVYLLRARRYRDVELEKRGSSVLLSMPLRIYFSWAIRPLYRLVERSGLPPAAITTLSWLLSVGAGVALAAGRFALGGWLFLAAGLCDFFDGRLARHSGKASPRGAALDSIVDRYGDAAVLVGLAWYYRDSWVLVAVLITLVGSLLISYVRARGEGLGTDVKVGLMQRPERVVLLGLTVALSPVEAALRTPDDPKPMHWLAVGGLVVLALATQGTALQRFIHVLRRLPGSPGEAGWIVPANLALAATISAGIATAADFGLVSVMVELAAATPWVATIIGCVLGALVNFTINRRFVFRSQDHPAPQLARYALVSATSALLNAGGVAVLLLLDIDYRLAWVLVRGAVFVGWNLPLQRDYVYASRDEQPRPSHRTAAAVSALAISSLDSSHR
jgi:phosphatidylglycerophosphate synthase/putative flippase GtrA